MLTESIAVPARTVAPVAQPSILPGNLGYIVGPFTGAATTTILDLVDWEDEEAVANHILPNAFMVGIHVQGRTATIWFQMKDFSLVEKRVSADEDLQEKLRMAISDHPELFAFPLA